MKRELDQEVKRMVWVIFVDEIGDVTGGRVVDGFVYCCSYFKLHSLGKQKPVDGMIDGRGT